VLKRVGEGFAWAPKHRRFLQGDVRLPAVDLADPPLELRVADDQPAGRLAAAARRGHCRGLDELHQVALRDAASGVETAHGAGGPDRLPELH
jgi:hypothetical protein